MEKKHARTTLQLRGLFIQHTKYLLIPTPGASCSFQDPATKHFRHPCSIPRTVEIQRHFCHFIELVEFSHEFTRKYGLIIHFHFCDGEILIGCTGYRGRKMINAYCRSLNRTHGPHSPTSFFSPTPTPPKKLIITPPCTHAPPHLKHKHKSRLPNTNDDQIIIPHVSEYSVGDNLINPSHLIYWPLVLLQHTDVTCSISILRFVRAYRQTHAYVPRYEGCVNCIGIEPLSDVIRTPFPLL